MPGKFPSVWRVVVIAGAGAVLTTAMTPAFAGRPLAKPSMTKKHPSDIGRAARPAAGGNSGRMSLEWAITSVLRP
ncbi:MAG: hypothetical protein ABI454_01690 [Sphingomicrobium sp.]